MHAIALGLLLTCPNLTGKFATCRSLSGNIAATTDLVVTQVPKNGATLYTLTSTDSTTQERESETYLADGKTHTQTETDPDTGDIVSLATTISCTANEVIGKMVLKYDREIYTTITTTLSKSGNTLTQTMKGKSMDEEVNETIICE